MAHGEDSEKSQSHMLSVVSVTVPTSPAAWFYESTKTCSSFRQSPVYSSRGVLHTNTNPSVTNGNNMRFVCPICGKKISTKGNLKVHLETHRPKGKYGCDICGRV